MLTTIEGVYRDGKIELSEIPQNIQEEMFVIVTFISSMKIGKTIDLQSRGIDQTHAADLRARLATFAEDWESPEMEIYDNYDKVKSTL
jgi:hypothetical protein